MLEMLVACSLEFVLNPPVDKSEIHTDSQVAGSVLSINLLGSCLNFKLTKNKLFWLLYRRKNKAFCLRTKKIENKRIPPRQIDAL